MLGNDRASELIAINPGLQSGKAVEAAKSMPHRLWRRHVFSRRA
jgi:hypothetical protein